VIGNYIFAIAGFIVALEKNQAGNGSCHRATRFFGQQKAGYCPPALALLEKNYLITRIFVSCLNGE
jgi:hypothetical protein